MEKIKMTEKNIAEFAAAIETGKFDRVKSMLQAGADPDWQFEGTPLLTYAIVCMDADSVRIPAMLLAYGAAVDAVDDLGNTALIEAARYGYCKVAGLLIDFGADPGKQGRFGQTAMGMAVSRDYPEIINLLNRSGQ